ncbi:Hsp70 chaperone [Rhodosporidiobolus nylandii]
MRAPFSTVFSAKRLIGRKFSDPDITNKATKPLIQVDYKGETNEFTPEEIRRRGGEEGGEEWGDARWGVQREGRREREERLWRWQRARARSWRALSVFESSELPAYSTAPRPPSPPHAARAADADYQTAEMNSVPPARDLERPHLAHHTASSGPLEQAKLAVEVAARAAAKHAVPGCPASDRLIQAHSSSPSPRSTASGASTSPTAAVHSPQTSPASSCPPKQDVLTVETASLLSSSPSLPPRSGSPPTPATSPSPTSPTPSGRPSSHLSTTTAIIPEAYTFYRSPLLTPSREYWFAHRADPIPRLLPPSIFSRVDPFTFAIESALYPCSSQSDPDPRVGVEPFWFKSWTPFLLALEPHEWRNIGLMQRLEKECWEGAWATRKEKEDAKERWRMRIRGCFDSSPHGENVASPFPQQHEENAPAASSAGEADGQVGVEDAEQADRQNGDAEQADRQNGANGEVVDEPTAAPAASPAADEPQDGDDLAPPVPLVASSSADASAAEGDTETSSAETVEMSPAPTAGEITGEGASEPSSPTPTPTAPAPAAARKPLAPGTGAKPAAPGTKPAGAPLRKVVGAAVGSVKPSASSAPARRPLSSSVSRPSTSYPPSTAGTTSTTGGVQKVSAPPSASASAAPRAVRSSLSSSTSGPRPAGRIVNTARVAPSAAAAEKPTAGVRAAKSPAPPPSTATGTSSAPSTTARRPLVSSTSSAAAPRARPSAATAPASGIARPGSSASVCSSGTTDTARPTATAGAAPGANGTTGVRKPAVSSSSTAPASATGAAQPTPGASAAAEKVKDLEVQLSAAQASLAAKESELARLQASLEEAMSTSSNEVETLRAEVESLKAKEGELEQLRREVERLRETEARKESEVDGRVERARREAREAKSALEALEAQGGDGEDAKKDVEEKVATSVVRRRR